MRFLLLTPGTGHFYCGSCLRDNALARELRRQGHEVQLAPLYLPHFVEDEATSIKDSAVHMGGINMYLQQKSRLAKRLPRFIENFFDRPSLLRFAAKRGSMTEAADLGDMLLSMLRGEHGQQSKEVAKLAAWIASVEPPDVIVLSNIMLVGVVRALKSVTDAKIVVTLQGEQPFIDALGAEHRDAAWATLRERVREVDLLLPVSRTYGELMRERLGPGAPPMRVVLNGLDVDDFSQEPPRLAARRPRSIGYLARMCREKGLHTLVEAYCLLRTERRFDDLQLEVVGVCLREDEDFVASLRQRLERQGLLDKVSFAGNVDRAHKLAFLARIQVLSVPATYGESFGLYLLEAMASGVPVVEPRHGAFPELIAATGGGLLCEPDDATSLARGLATLLDDAVQAQALADRGRAAVHANFTASFMARSFVEACQAVN